MGREPASQSWAMVLHELGDELVGLRGKPEIGLRLLEGRERLKRLSLIQTSRSPFSLGSRSTSTEPSGSVAKTASKAAGVMAMRIMPSLRARSEVNPLPQGAPDTTSIAVDTARLGVQRPPVGQSAGGATHKGVRHVSRITHFGGAGFLALQWGSYRVSGPPTRSSMPSCSRPSRTRARR